MQQQEIIEDGELFSALTSHIAGGMIRVPALFGKPPAPLFTLRKHVEWSLITCASSRGYSMVMLDVRKPHSV